MSWELSRFRTGDLVEVRTKEEVLATLDEHGCVDGMPFMPEMMQYCGRRFNVGAVAHKTCDTAHQTWTGRRLHATVHLAGLRCDGSVHDGCQAECNLFWKDVWLKPAHDSPSIAGTLATKAARTATGSCTESQLVANTRQPAATDGAEPRYSCQATQMYEATEPLAPWDPRQYLYDVWTGNHSSGRVLRILWLSWFRWLLPRVPRGYRLVKSISEWMHRWLTGRPSPSLDGKIKPGCLTPTGRLHLKPGEYVRIKSKAEIENTLDETGKNRGLSFDPEEMAPYCGGVFKVWKSVTQIIDEPTGKMIRMKQPCIMLEGVVCKGEYASCRLNCPRAIPSYWRELWLERVDPKVPESQGAATNKSELIENASHESASMNSAPYERQLVQIGLRIVGSQ